MPLPLTSLKPHWTAAALVICLCAGWFLAGLLGLGPSDGTPGKPRQIAAHPASLCDRRVPTLGDDGCPHDGTPQRIDLIVIHHCGETFESCIGTFTQDRGVSAHYLISGTGIVVQMVADRDKAFHATYVNPRSIGIELVGSGGADYTAPMYEALAQLLAVLSQRHGLPLVHPVTKASYPSCLAGVVGVIGHYQVQPKGAERCGYSPEHVKHDPTECAPGLRNDECFQWDALLRRAAELTLKHR